MPALVKRGLALTLPVCLMWLFAACLAVCSHHAEQASVVESESSFSAPSLVSTESEECCSVSDGERSVIPERITFAGITTTAVRAISIPVHSGFNTSHLRERDRYFPPGPNLNLLGTLRI
jgi:hypothetical protein